MSVRSDERVVAYVVSRFPLITETFILREFEAVDAADGWRVELFALFPTGESQGVHERARPWLDRAHRPSVIRGLAALAHWASRRPGRVLSLLGSVVRDYWTSPRLLARALVAAVAAMEVAIQVRRRSVDHIHAHFASYPALAAWIAAELTGVRFSFTPHAHDIFTSQLGLKRKLRAASFVVAISEYNRRFLQHFGADPNRLPIVRYGIDPRPYATTRRPFPSVGPVRGVLVASFRPYKGHRYLVDAVAQEQARLDRITIECIGDGPLRPSIEELTRATGTARQFAFLGNLEENAVAERLHEADFLVQPSIVQDDGDTEGIPNSLIEGMAAGLPVISTRVSGIPELVQHGVTGLLAEPRNSQDLAGRLLELLENPEQTERIARKAQRIVVEEYSVERLGDVMRALFAGVLGGPGS